MAIVEPKHNTATYVHPHMSSQCVISSVTKPKKRKMTDNIVNNKEVAGKVKKCEFCKQKMIETEIKLYPGHPNNATEECVTLKNPKLCLFTSDENNVHELDECQQKITHFNVYDESGHLCPFDTGLIEKNIKLYFSGYVKAIYEEDATPEGGLPTKDLGPINEWFVSGFDGGESALVGFNTDFAEYILMEPSEEYAAFMEPFREKIYMSKIIIEYILDEINPSYEDLLNRLQTVVLPKGLSKFDEDLLFKHAQFICDRVISFDFTAMQDDPILITTSCMRSLISLAGVNLGKREINLRRQRKMQRDKKSAWTKATTTPLVAETFESFFKDQLGGDKESMCHTNMTIQEADGSDPEDEDEYETLAEATCSEKEERFENSLKYLENDVEWFGDSIAKQHGETYYAAAKVAGEIIKINDCVMIEVNNCSTPMQVAQVIYMWQDSLGNKVFHANWYWRACDTILGETAGPAELFRCEKCDTVSFDAIYKKVTVIEQAGSVKWPDNHDIDIKSEQVSDDADRKTFFCHKRYLAKTARFQDFILVHNSTDNCSYRFCSACDEFLKENRFNVPKVFEKLEEKGPMEVTYGVVKYKGEEFRVGSAVFLQPGCIKFNYKSPQQILLNPHEETVDEDMYTEYYRKITDRVKNLKSDTPEPFHIGFITSIFATTSAKWVFCDQIWITVNKMYRPENTHKDVELTRQADLNVLYWSDEEFKVRFSNVSGKCYLAYSKNLQQSVEEWTSGGPNRFYFTESFSATEKAFSEPPQLARHIGKCSKETEQDRSIKSAENRYDKAVDYWTVKGKLKTLDVFAGCGGLSEGLTQAGIADLQWAIENEESAANAYLLNNPNATVFAEDCNMLLRKILDGACKDSCGQTLPLKNEIDLLCGGPPCQGFSGMNRFNSRQYSLLQNSLVPTYLSFCDYYRPRYFIMENVRNFVSFKKNMVLKLTLRCLTRMGYQCTFGILQAGNYGVPQTRRRMFILAAAPGEILPNLPEPTHVFSKRACQLHTMIDGKKYCSNCEWTDSALYRTISVRDAMSDLPSIKNGCNKEQIRYDKKPKSHFQRKMRGTQEQPILSEHICKQMAPLVEARMSRIPTESGSDWRDLPNMVVRLSDGTFCSKLEYPYHYEKAGESTTWAFRGVCVCCTGKPCDSGDKQNNTLIPWCLPHTGNRNNHWAGLYGRLEWDGFFYTTITNPEPMGKQGRVLHPEQHRVVSVRECARSQGFPDTYHLYGNILDKYRQVGNAVPPPVSIAIGYEIRKCLSMKANAACKNT